MKQSSMEGGDAPCGKFHILDQRSKLMTSDNDRLSLYPLQKSSPSKTVELSFTAIARSAEKQQDVSSLLPELGSNDQNDR
jgi:hypothetical protein